MCIAGATGWTGRALVRGVLDAPDLHLRAAVSRSAAGRDLGEALGGETLEVPVYGSVPEVRKQDVYRQNPHAGVYDTSRAREILGWTPSVTWADLVDRVDSPRG